MMKNVIQVAGIIDKEEAQLILDCGVHYLGFPLRLPVNKEDISDSDAANIIKSLRPPNFGVLITYLNEAKEIIELCNYLGSRFVQIHGDITSEEMSRLKQIDPNLKIIKSLVVRKNNLDELETVVKKFSPYVVAFITDTYDPTTGASGATGKTHDWAISRHLVEISPKPVILAGGLNPSNVCKAILEVKPAGVDTHTGVEDKNGRKNRDMVLSFVSESKKGFELIS